jgi:gliding motility-associated-like protein
VNSLTVTKQPSSGAEATIANGVLTINYNGIAFSGSDQLTIQACDTNGNCATQVFAITVAGDIVVYNGLSPNGKNPAFIIEYIDVLPETKNNSVYIFDRWENQVWQGNNYNNTSVVFTGVSDGGSDLPSGVYFYKINFASGRKTVTGFISLRRQ